MSKNRHFIGIFIYIFALLHLEGSISMDDFAFRCPAFYLYDVVPHMSDVRHSNCLSLAVTSGFQ